MSKIAAIDFETANSNCASVCAVGIVTMDDGVVNEPYYSLIKPEENVSEFNYWNIKVHGIQPVDVIDAPVFSSVYPQMLEQLNGRIACAHNARFDMSCIKATCANVGIEVPKIRYFDTVTLSRKILPKLSHHRLNDVCEYIKVNLNHHHAGSDAYGCLMIVEYAMRQSGIYNIEELLHNYGIKISEIG